MAATSSYKRALLKMSGDAFTSSETNDVFDNGKLEYIGKELQKAQATGWQLAIVVGGGNIMRGAKFSPRGSGRIDADNAGMMATIVNAFILKHVLEEANVAVKAYSAINIPGIIEGFDRRKGIADLEDGNMVVLAGGTGNPLFTTDTAAALRALQLDAQIVLKATRVDGVYDADPEQDGDARLFERLGYEDVLSQKLGVMDLCAVSLCMEHELPVRVFNYQVKGNLERALNGENTGTFIGNYTE
jgi:uridylate kinase